ncbi:phosphate acyltransferase PlsX [Campylobacter sp. RM9344]|uniref:Phosphate acyltransferase n=1 Tax=Campylobacter californiensis TaxID=1032243 RepID=A0AAW3ZWZ5_9BACT|nr:MULTISPECIES: phosphate acyltransferase PlsX [unclassified Campylobacter]MBE2984189.1 phosphate acyltransferase PlsX [Campylobacter sp. RM6883]MBE2995558.1 phosphate acyltransferase PlsX [Campylobacter sp. RM6913]MBE3029773.1 phosphate acyltransferase PlsX [Campylobacter sp. RM9344]MBE3607758.1 phosphate acyltransferase PlsX [Campylobacter sp. RM9337]QCD51366.1 acyl phosphate synthase [Campylobacter sp. RM6914]
MIRIAIDAMGGDFGPEPIVAGVVEALKDTNFSAVLVGDSNAIKPLIPTHLLKNITFVKANEVVSMSDGATDALKRKDSTIYKSIELLRNKEVDAVVSAGHSGATMSLATLRVGRLKNVARPAIATLMPNSKDTTTLVLDVGANVDCKSEHLFQFAVMGEVYSKQILNRETPRVGLLSNGEEASKGNEVSKEAFSLISRLDSFVGNVEGNQVFDGSVDVVVCDGFIGNILLKTSEGVADAIGKIIKKQITKSPLAIAGSVLMKKVFKKLKKQVSYDEYGGAPLIGVNGCVIISHGKSNAKAIKNAVFQAINFANSDINKTIEEELSNFVR